MGLKQKVPPKKAATKKSNAKKSFAEAAADAAKSAVETVTVRTEAKAPRRRVSFEGVEQTKKTSAGKSNTSSKSKSTAAAAAAAAAAKRAAVSGIIEAKKRRRDEEKEAAAAEEEEEEEKDVEDSDDLHDDNNSASSNDNDDDDNESQNSEDDLSDVADAESEASDEAAWEEETNPFEKSQRDGTRLAYPALRLRFLPQEFQEPQLYKFLGQFGAQVLNCFCVRSRRTHQSKGIAYVQFDTDAVLPIVVEECHGMSLAGRALQAHRVILHRAMPTKEKTARRRRLAYVYSTRGRPLQRHDVRRKSPIAALVKYARKESANNAHLKRLGIDYESHSFAEQLASVPKDLIISKKEMSKLHLDNKSKKDNKKSNNKHVGRGGSSNGNGNGNGNGVDKKNKKNGVESTVVSSSLPTAGEAKRQKVENKSSNGTSKKKTVPVTTTTTAATTTASAVVSKKKATTTTPPPTQKRRTGVKKG